jgi:hypothetical protein
MPDTLDDAWAILSAALPGVDARPPKHQRSSLRRYPAPTERREARQIVDVRRRPVPAPPGELGPCSGCRHMARCSAEVIACEAFLLFVKLGDESSPERLKFAPRFPSRAIMERMLTPRRINRG